MTSIIDVKFYDCYNIEKAMNDGVIFNTRIRVDHTNKEIEFDETNYWDDYAQAGLNTGLQWKRRREEEELRPGKVTIEYLAKDTTEVVGHNKESKTEVVVPYLDRSQEIEIVVFGNNTTDVGQIIRVEIPAAAPKDAVDSTALDKRWSGNYYITAKRDKIDRKTHMMVLRCSKDSQITEDYS